jgi:hypothetical protein
MPERYPDADVLAQRGHWDDATRRVVLDRVHNTPDFRYFDAHQRATLQALCARVVPQTHRRPERRVAIAPWIDARCAGGHGDGFRFENMPSNARAWTLGLQGLDETTRALFGDDLCFKDLDETRQQAVLEAIRADDPPGEIWRHLPARRWWVYVALRQITAVYYAHPYAWDEIGFGGPAYPRGYFALNFGYPEPWEAREVGEQAGRSLRPRWRFP